MLLFRTYTSPTLIVWGTIVMGVFYGAAIPLCWSSVAEVFGKKYLGSIYGVVTNGFAVAALVGPLLAARLVDTTGSYDGAFFAIAGFGVLGMILAFTIKKRETVRKVVA
jgi:MFS family permease